MTCEWVYLRDRVQVGFSAWGKSYVLTRGFAIQLGKWQLNVHLTK